MITREQAMKAAHGEELYSMRSGYPRLRTDGLMEPRRARVAGRCRTWRAYPEHFRLPVKLNPLRMGEVTHITASDWTFDKQEALRALNPLHFVETSAR